MDRPGTKCATDADLAAGLFAPLRDDRIEAGFGAGGSHDRPPSAGRAAQTAATRRRYPERSSRNSQRSLAGLARTDAAGLVRPAIKGFERPAEASTDRREAARRTSHACNRAWRDGNADAQAHIGRIHPSFRALSSQPSAAAGVRETGSLLDGFAHCPGPAVF